MAVETLKVGRDKKDTPVTEIDARQLEWYANECRNAKLKGIAKRELARRKGGGRATPAQHQPSQAAGTQQQPTTTALAVESSFSNADRATKALKQAAQEFHLISPATMVGSLQEGCSVALALVHISPDDPHLYKVGDKLALDKTHLASIGNAAGVSIVSSSRTDDGSDPHYCAWTVRVRYRQFDGTWLIKQGSVEMDVREPFGAEYVDAVEKAANAERQRDPRRQIAELRRFITRHAESKAINRAYAAIGIRRSYTRDELERPFCVARVMFTGHSDDPEARRQFRQGIMESYLGSSEAAYGALPESAPPETPHPPPPQSYRDDPDTLDTEGEEFPPEDWEPEQAAPQQQQQPAATQPAAASSAAEDRGPNPEAY
jgi:hypothetical protein